MFKEVLQYLTTPCAPLYRKLGYIHELIAIQAKAKRVESQWQLHLQNTREVIVEAANACTQQDKVVVLGAGVLLDVPVQQLASRFKQVILVDLVQLNAVKRQLIQYKNVQWFNHDVTGVLHSIVNYRQGELLPDPQTSASLPCDKVDLLISVNLLSQLPVIPLQLLGRSGVSEVELSCWAECLQRAHLDLLKTSARQACLVTDTCHRYYDVQGNEIQRNDMLYGLSMPASPRQWAWHVAPYGEIDRNVELRADVKAWPQWPGHTG